MPSEIPVFANPSNSPLLKKSSRYLRMIRGFDFPKNTIDKALDALAEALAFVVQDLSLMNLLDRSVKQDSEYEIHDQEFLLNTIFSPEQALNYLEVIHGNELVNSLFKN